MIPTIQDFENMVYYPIMIRPTNFRAFRALAFALALLPFAGPTVFASESDGATETLEAPATSDFSAVPGVQLSATLEQFYAPSVDHGTPVAWLTLRNAASEHRSLNVVVQCPSIAEVSRTVELDAGERVRVPLVLPLRSRSNYYFGHRHYDSTLVIYENGTGKLLDLPIQLYRHTYTYSDRPQLLFGSLPSRVISPERFRAALAGKRTYGSTAGRRKPKAAAEESYECDILRCQLPPEQWPDDYRAYTTFDAVILSEEFAAALGEKTRAALAAFERLGGAVITTPVDGEGDTFGDVNEALRARERIHDAVQRLGDNTNYHDLPGGYDTLFQQLPLAVTGSLPVKSISVLLAFFALVAVPTILILSARRNRRLAILVALPCAALALTAVIVALSLAVFGLTPTVRVQSIAWLDQGRREAVARGRIAIFSPVSLSGELVLPSDAGFRQRHAQDSQNLRLRLGEPQRFLDGWVNPLESAFLGFDRRSHQNERLDVTRNPDGSIKVVNLLGAPVEQGEIRLARTEGTLATYRLGALDAGASVTLAATNVCAAAAARPAAEAVSSATDWGRSWPKLVLAVTDGGLAPTNGYALVLAGSPFLPPPLGDRKTHGSSATLVIGTFAAEGTK